MKDITCILSIGFALVAFAEFVFTQDPPPQILKIETDRQRYGWCTDPPANSDCSSRESIDVKVTLDRDWGDFELQIQVTDGNVGPSKLISSRVKEFKWELKGLRPAKYHLLARAILPPREASDFADHSIEVIDCNCFASLEPGESFVQSPLLGIWVESNRLQCDHYREDGGGYDKMSSHQRVREFILDPNGSFSVTVKPFETYVDYWGHYSLDLNAGTISFWVAGGNVLPRWKKATGEFKLAGGRLIIKNVRFTDERLCTRAVVFQRPGDDISENVEAELIDEFPASDLCSLKAKIDVLLDRLSGNADDSGEVVLYRTPTDLGFAHRARRVIMQHLVGRGMSPKRVKITVGPVRNVNTVQLWLVTPAASDPVLLESVLDDPPGGPVRPYRYALDPFDGPQTCGGAAYDYSDFAEFLKEDEDIKGRVVINASTLSRFTRQRAQIVAALSRFGVDRRRVRFVNGRTSAKKESVALWVVD